ncbi:MAG: DNA polymerase III subunit gamma/tau [Alphaproteobacteria bacterium]|nr:DNA polymerase III subunit gamma/tau [Alphaproteobacteria bacterium]MBL0717827.1 DNA polymerase III subunit gamma/tau [Alphaproteobacteria bacterium]
MSFQGLARKYRSLTFSDLIGQDLLVKTLQSALKTKRLSQAYLFTGVHGTGKTSVARILSKAFNCKGTTEDLKSSPSEPCMVCSNCKSITKGSNIDVIEIDAASHTGVDMIRDIIQSTQYKPIYSRNKIYIIDEVHMLSKGAFNALLKTIEEPPPNLVFMFATTEVKSIPTTILSRCQRYDLSMVSVEDLKNHLIDISNREGVKLGEEESLFIAKSSGGSVRDSISLLDQSIVQMEGEITIDGLRRLFKVVESGVVFNLLSNILDQDITSMMTMTEELYKKGVNFRKLMFDILEGLYWLSRSKLTNSDLSGSQYSESETKKIILLSKNLTLLDLTRMWQFGVSGLEDFKSGLNSKLIFDMLSIRMSYGSGKSKKQSVGVEKDDIKEYIKSKIPNVKFN